MHAYVRVAELYGRVLRVNYAQPAKIRGGDKGWASQPVWADADDWYERQQAEQALTELEEERRRKTEADALAAQLPPDAMQQAEAAAAAVVGEMDEGS
jgi:peptidyl-prolyl isomerase E (cyclophilin E)